MKAANTASKNVIVASSQVKGTRCVLHVFTTTSHKCHTSKKQRVSFFFVA